MVRRHGGWHCLGRWILITSRYSVKTVLGAIAGRRSVCLAAAGCLISVAGCPDFSASLLDRDGRVAVDASPVADGGRADLACADRDRDGVSTCDGDCNDANPSVYPGQLSFFDHADPVVGFDYNCDGAEEREHDAAVDCKAAQGICGGDGWAAYVVIPGCGEEASFVACKGLHCWPDVPTTVTQGCR